MYVLVISRYKDDIVVITRDQGGAKVECNNHDNIIWLASIPSNVKTGNYIITSCLVNKRFGDNYRWMNWEKN